MKIALLGDIALIGKYDMKNNSQAKARLRVIVKKLDKYDYVVANLETPITERMKTWVCKSMHLKTQSVNVELLKYLRVNAVSLANNHICDFGKTGLMNTIAALESNGIEWFGVNSNYLIKEIKGEKVCLSGFCCYSTNGTGYIEGDKQRGINTLTYDNVMRQLETDKKNDAFSILSFHWGKEHTNYPNYEHICLANAVARKKDVIIHGHHPHIIQGIQELKGSVVAYSLGNCLFDDCTSINGSFSLKQTLDNKKSFIFEVDIEKGRIVKFGYHGFKDEDDGIVFSDINQEIKQISEPLKRIEEVSFYEAMRKEQFNEAILKKFGKHDMKWLISRLNYYSVGAHILSKLRKRKYMREVNKFLAGSENKL